MDKPMEHLKQWHNLFAGILNPSETALYIHLFMVANCRFWPDWIELTDSQLALGTNISIKRIPDTINSLVQKKLIESERGKGKNPSKYNICPFPNYTQTGVINGRKTGDKREINGRKTGDKREINGRLEENSPCGSRDGKPSKTQLTQHKDKDIKNTIGARANFVPPTLDEVNAYIMEKGVHVSAQEFWDYFTETGWVDAKGQR
ncbi:MAG: hypothetical protein IJV85_04520, partial [Clostridia bacterium]|nr:hypothetical protein [Clostridia bacterium]